MYTLFICNCEKSDRVSKISNLIDEYTSSKGKYSCKSYKLWWNDGVIDRAFINFESIADFYMMAITLGMDYDKISMLIDHLCTVYGGFRFEINKENHRNVDITISYHTNKDIYHSIITSSGVEYSSLTRTFSYHIKGSHNEETARAAIEDIILKPELYSSKGMERILAAVNDAVNTFFGKGNIVHSTVEFDEDSVADKVIIIIKSVFEKEN